jgi:hypothetical protein
VPNQYTSRQSSERQAAIDRLRRIAAEEASILAAFPDLHAHLTRPGLPTVRFWRPRLTSHRQLVRRP